jgi:penicillin-binding protein 1C
MKVRFYTLVVIIALISAIGIAGWSWLFKELPDLDELPRRLQTPSVRIVDREGRLLYEALPGEGGRNTVVPLEAIPSFCRQATIATEDRSFYSNPGVDLRGILRAAWINLRGGETLAGGSTITQQVARNLLLSPAERGERTIKRKLRESLLAWQLTREFSKDEILALYLNQTYYGGMAYGIESAAQTFFGKPVERLDLAECAVLAGLPQAPALYNPFTEPESALERQHIVLGLMERDGFITSEQAQLAQGEPLIYSTQPYPVEALHFVMMVLAQIDSRFSPEEIQEMGSLLVRTTLDLDWQRHAEKAVIHQLAALKRSDAGLGHNVNNAALTALDPHNGDILALVGSPDYFEAEQGGAINMAISPRQPGSALKPLVYAAALDPQKATGGWTATTMLLDVKTSFLTIDGRAYIPANYDLREHGPVLLREALASSLNIPAVLALEHVGLEEFFDFSRKLGISTLGDPEEFDLSLALGGGAVRLIDLSAAYGVFANGGYRVEPRLILEARDIQGRTFYEAPENTRTRVLDERIAWLISDILSDNDARRIGFGANSILRLDRAVAVKTGTTSNFHDNWTIGYTPDLVVGVWSGNTDYEPMRAVNGLTGAAPIWHEFMRAVLSGSPEQVFRRPAGLEQEEVCALSGLLPSEACNYRKMEWFIAGTQPQKVDSIYRQVTLDSSTGLPAEPETPPDRRIRMTVLDLPAEARFWASEQGLLLYSDVIDGESGEARTSRAYTLVEEETRASPLVLISPAPGSTFRLDPGFLADAQRIRLEARAEPGLTQISIWVDDEQVSSPGNTPELVWWKLEAGQHRAWVEAIGPDGSLITSPVVIFWVL